MKTRTAWWIATASWPVGAIILVPLTFPLSDDVLSGVWWTGMLTGAVLNLLNPLVLLFVAPAVALAKHVENLQNKAR